MIGKTIRRGVQCTTCHTVYFIEHASNRDRLYYASPRSLEVKQDSRIPLHEVAACYKRKTEENAVFWNLLCICSQQISFVKTELKWYEASRTAFERGHAIEGEWKEVDERIAHLQNHLRVADL